MRQKPYYEAPLRGFRFPAVDFRVLLGRYYSALRGAAKNIRRHAGSSPKGRRKAALGRKTGAQGDFDERQLTASQQLTCPFDAPRNYVLMRCNADALLEQPGEMSTAHRTDLRQFPNPEIS